MKPVVKRATPAAIAVLRQATALWPKRKKASDGLLPSAAHIKQSPNSDHNTGLAVDLTHDPANGVDCRDIYERLQQDGRVKYLIFKGKIWNQEDGERVYKGSNPHDKHLHISIKDKYANDDSNWFGWMGKIPKKIKLPRPLPKKTGETMRDLIAKLKDPKTKAAFKSYLRAVLASAITMGLALAADLAPEYAILIGSIAGPLAKWADRTEEQYGLGSE